MKKICETCTFWTAHNLIDNRGFCQALRANRVFDGNPQPARLQLKYNNEGMTDVPSDVFFLTAPDFGCMNWSKS